VIKRVVLLFIPISIFLGCSQVEYTTRDRYLITIKTKEMRYSDMGFIARGDDAVVVDIFSVGSQILKLNMGNSVSLNDGSPIRYSRFNSKYLHSDYPPKTVREIFLGKEIFGGEGKSVSESGFEQKIDKISYSVSSDNIVFRDRENSVLIKIKKVK
jgi:hypothetical protein